MTDPRERPSPWDIDSWETVMWRDLNALPEEEQFIAAGAWIAHITQVILPALGLHRREVILRLIEERGWDTTQVAEQLGSRKATVIRLADEGRAFRKASAIGNAAA